MRASKCFIRCHILSQFDEKLGPKKEAAILALLSSQSMEDAARVAGVIPRTLYRWLGEPAFNAAYCNARRAIYSQYCHADAPDEECGCHDSGESHGRPEQGAGYQNKSCGFNSESYGQGDEISWNGPRSRQISSCQAPPKVERKLEGGLTVHGFLSRWSSEPERPRPATIPRRKSDPRE